MNLPVAEQTLVKSLSELTLETKEVWTVPIEPEVFCFAVCSLLWTFLLSYFSKIERKKQKRHENFIVGVPYV